MPAFEVGKVYYFIHKVPTQVVIRPIRLKDVIGEKKRITYIFEEGIPGSGHRSVTEPELQERMLTGRMTDNVTDANKIFDTYLREIRGENSPKHM